MATSTTTPSPLRILMLHGYTQSGPLFRAKTRALEKTLSKTLKQQYPTHFSNTDLVYPTAPIRIRPADIPGFLSSSGENHGNDDTQEQNEDKVDPDTWGWWIRRGEKEPFTYEGIETGLNAVAEELQKAAAESKPFDGVLGFSQGGALAGMVASLLESGRKASFDRLEAQEGGMSYPSSFVNDNGMVEEPIHPPLKFAVSYSGFGATTNKLYTGFYEPKIATPMLHFLGSVDTIVEEARSQRLIDACADGGVGRGGKSRVLRHPGGHFLPTGAKPWVTGLADFIAEAEGWSGGDVKEKEERVEDMEVPF